MEFGGNTGRYTMQQTDMVHAKVIATKFLEQYHGNVQTKNIVLDDNVYLVTLETGLLEKKMIQVRVDAKTGKILGFGYLADFEKIANSILDMAAEIRYVLVVDSKGRLVHNKMAKGKIILIKNEDQISNLSVDLQVLRQLLCIFDESLGKTTFVHFEREKINILLIYIRDLVFCVTCERSLDTHQLADISNKIRATIEMQIGRNG